MDYNEIIAAASEGKPADIQRAIDAALTQKVSELVAQERLNLAKSYFEPQDDSEEQAEDELETDEAADSIETELEDLVQDSRNTEDTKEEQENGTED